MLPVDVPDPAVIPQGRRSAGSWIRPATCAGSRWTVVEVGGVHALPLTVRQPAWRSYCGSPFARAPSRFADRGECRSPSRRVERFQHRMRVNTAVMKANPERVADGVYGTVLVLAVISALSKDHAASAWAVLAGVLTTALVFWIVHIYAAMLGDRAAGNRTGLRVLMHEEWPLAESALAPAVPLLIAGIGVFGLTAGITLALIVGVLDLAFWGYVAGRAMSQSRLGAVASGLAAMALGIVMVLLKNLVH